MVWSTLWNMLIQTRRNSFRRLNTTVIYSALSRNVKMLPSLSLKRNKKLAMHWLLSQLSKTSFQKS